MEKTQDEVIHLLHAHQRLLERGEVPIDIEHTSVQHNHSQVYRGKRWVFTHTHPVATKNGRPVDDYHNRFSGLAVQRSS